MSRPVVDIHAHFVPEGYLRAIETDGAVYGLGLRAGPGGPLIMVGRVPIGPITPGYHDLDRRLRDVGPTDEEFVIPPTPP